MQQQKIFFLAAAQVYRTQSKAHRFWSLLHVSKTCDTGTLQCQPLWLPPFLLPNICTSALPVLLQFVAYPCSDYKWLKLTGPLAPITSCSQVDCAHECDLCALSTRVVPTWHSVGLCLAVWQLKGWKCDIAKESSRRGLWMVRFTTMGKYTKQQCFFLQKLNRFPAE